MPRGFVACALLIAGCHGSDSDGSLFGGGGPLSGSPGALDTGFGTAGKFIGTAGLGNDEALAIAIQTDGKIVLAGYVFNGIDEDFAIIRLNPNGVLDATFGTGGVVITPVGSASDRATDVAIQADGKILLAGSSHNGTDLDVAAIRIWP